MKKIIFTFMILFSNLLLGVENNNFSKKADTILSTQEELKDRLKLLKEKEIYIENLEKKLKINKKKIDLEKKYKKIEKEYLFKRLNDSGTKKKFLEFEYSSYQELLKRIDNIKNKL